MNEKEAGDRSRLEALKQLSGMTLLSLSHIPDGQFDDIVKIIKNFFGVYLDIRDEYTYAELLEKMVQFGLSDTNGEIISKYIELLCDILYKNHEITSEDISNVKNRFVELVNNLIPDEAKPLESAKKQSVLGIFSGKPRVHGINSPEGLEKEIIDIENTLKTISSGNISMLQLKVESLKGDLRLWKVDAKAIDSIQVNQKLDAIRKELPHQEQIELQSLEEQANGLSKIIGGMREPEQLQKEIESVREDIRKLRIEHGDLKHLKAKIQSISTKLSQKAPPDDFSKFDSKIIEAEKAIYLMEPKKSEFLKLELETLKGDLKLMRADSKSFKSNEFEIKVDDFIFKVTGKKVQPVGIIKSEEKTGEIKQLPQKKIEPSVKVEDKVEPSLKREDKLEPSAKGGEIEAVEKEILSLESTIAAAGDTGLKANFVRLEMESLKNDIRLFKADPKTFNHERVAEKIKSIKKLLSSPPKVEKKQEDISKDPLSNIGNDIFKLEGLVAEAEKKGTKNPFLRLEFDSLKADFDLCRADTKSTNLANITKKVQTMRDRLRKLGLLIK